MILYRQRKTKGFLKKIRKEFITMGFDYGKVWAIIDQILRALWAFFTKKEDAPVEGE